MTNNRLIIKKFAYAMGGIGMDEPMSVAVDFVRHSFDSLDVTTLRVKQ